MMKVYDMATCEVCEPRDAAPAPVPTAARAHETAIVPALALHQTAIVPPTDAQRARQAALIQGILDRLSN